jgi:hypothetical protein
MLTIYKYTLLNQSAQRIKLPLGAQLLTAKLQHNVVCLWAMVDTSIIETEMREIEMLLTGQEIEVPYGRHYLGTVLINNGEFVFHYFERFQY